jgi:hypothetical protein
VQVECEYFGSDPKKSHPFSSKNTWHRVGRSRGYLEEFYSPLYGNPGSRQTDQTDSDARAESLLEPNPDPNPDADGTDTARARRFADYRKRSSSPLGSDQTGNVDEPVRAFCLNGCSGRGECRRGFCVCEAGWTGIDCSVPLIRLKTDDYM